METGHGIKYRQLHIEDYLQEIPAERGRVTGVYAHEWITGKTGTDTDFWADNLLDMILRSDNLNAAYKKVKANKGSGGIDGMQVDELLPYLRDHQAELVQEVREGKYKPNPVRRVEIPKEEKGKVRKLGIPTVVDRRRKTAVSRAEVLDGCREPDRRNEYLSNAKMACKAGYTVYDKNGTAVYTVATAEGTQAADLAGLAEATFVRTVGPLFTADQQKTGVLAALSMAQMILESGWCSTELAKNANNCFGMKKTLSGNTWKGSTWDGKSIYTKQTQEEENGKTVTITADFRKYDCVEDSIADHSAYLVGAKNGTALRYAGLKGEADYKKAAKIVKNGGYATDSKYVTKLCNLIEKYSLTDYNAEAEKTTETTETTETSSASTFTPYKVRVTSDVLRVRKGPGTSHKVVRYTGKGVFTIIEEKDGWGRLKSKAGWICLTVSCVKKI